MSQDKRLFFNIRFNPAQESIKCYTSGEIMGMMPSIILLRLPGTCDIRYFRTKLFLTSRHPFLITFTTKSYLRSETYIACKFYTLYPQIDF